VSAPCCIGGPPGSARFLDHGPPAKRPPEAATSCPPTAGGAPAADISRRLCTPPNRSLTAGPRNCPGAARRLIEACGARGIEGEPGLQRRHRSRATAASPQGFRLLSTPAQLQRDAACTTGRRSDRRRQLSGGQTISLGLMPMGACDRPTHAGAVQLTGHGPAAGCMESVNRPRSLTSSRKASR